GSATAWRSVSGRVVPTTSVAIRLIVSADTDGRGSEAGLVIGQSPIRYAPKGFCCSGRRGPSEIPERFRRAIGLLICYRTERGHVPQARASFCLAIWHYTLSHSQFQVRLECGSGVGQSWRVRRP